MNKNSTLHFVAAIALAGAFACAAADAAAVEFTAEEKALLASGKMIKKPLPTSGEGGFYGGTGYIVVKAPPEVIWRAIEDWGVYPKVYPKTVAVTEVARKGNNSLVHMEMGHELIRMEYYVDLERNPEKNMLTFRLVKNRPHDIGDTRGYWRLFPQANGHTLVAYVVATQIPMGILNLVPADLVAKIERNLLGVPHYLRRWVEGPNGAPYRAAVASK